MTVHARLARPETRLDRGARLTLIGAVLLAAAGLAVLTWRYSLPTDGWWSRLISDERADTLIFSRNLLNAPSDLQPGDRLLAVNGLSVQEEEGMGALAGEWQAGRTVIYTVEREGTPIDVNVPLVHWNLAGLMRIVEFYPEEITDTFGEWLFVAIALFTLLKRPANHAARALLLLAGTFMAASAIDSILPFGVAEAVNPALTFVQNLLTLFLYSVLLPPTLLRFVLVFPRLKPSLLRRPWLEYAPYLVGLVNLPLAFLTNGISAWIWTTIAVIGAVIGLIHNSLTMRDAVSRAQLRWALGGMIAGLLLDLIAYPVSFGLVPDTLARLLQIAAGFGTLVIGVSLSIAVLRYRLYDIDLIIRRTLIYGALSLLLALIYFGIVALLQGFLSTVVGQLSAPSGPGPEGTGPDAVGDRVGAVVIVASTLAIAALFSPLRRRVQAFIDHRFYRRKYDAARTLAAFGQTVRDETDIERLSGRLVEVVHETMQPAQVMLWLVRSGSLARPSEPARRVS